MPVATAERFLRATGPGTFDVYFNGKVVGTVRQEGVWYDGPSTDNWRPGYKARTRNDNIPMPNGSVLAADKDGKRASYEKRVEPVHATPEDAARMIVLAVETARILNAQIDYERARGWSTD